MVLRQCHQISRTELGRKLAVSEAEQLHDMCAFFEHDSAEPHRRSQSAVTVRQCVAQRLVSPGNKQTP